MCVPIGSIAFTAITNYQMKGWRVVLVRVHQTAPMVDNMQIGAHFLIDCETCRGET